MFVEHGQYLKRGQQNYAYYYLRSVPLVHFNFLVEVYLAFYRNVIQIL